MSPSPAPERSGPLASAGPVGPGGFVEALEHRLLRPVDGAALAFFRVAFGLIMAWGATRYFTNDWLEKLFTGPSFHFRYYGFEWVPAPGPLGARALVLVLFFASALVALGLAFRLAALAMLLSFAWLELIDVATYLNHHYLAGLLCFLLLLSPAERVFSLDAWHAARRGRPLPSTVPAVAQYALRFQLAVVYFYAGLAKLGSDWLLFGQPLGIWLGAITDRPVLGPWLGHPLAPLVLSWCGFLYDLTIWLFLSWRRTRGYAYALVLAFHALTRVFFDIGLFPWIMSAATTCYFEPDWPRRLLSRLGLGAPRQSAAADSTQSGRLSLSPAGRFAVATLAAGYVATQLLVPLRHFAFPSDVLWAEDGMRWSWRVMVREKSASITYDVRGLRTGRRALVSPLKSLTPRQFREMGGQPDLILQLAHHLAAEHRARWGEPVAVYADTWLSFNGRPAARFINPEVDLAEVKDGLTAASFVLPRPLGPPTGTRSLALGAR